MKNILYTIAVIFTLILTSCSGKLNKDNYDKISNDMSVSQVESILGKGESQASSNVDLGEYGGNISSEVMTWQSGTKVISITFSNGKVMAKMRCTHVHCTLTAHCQTRASDVPTHVAFRVCTRTYLLSRVSRNRARRTNVNTYMTGPCPAACDDRGVPRARGPR